MQLPSKGFRNMAPTQGDCDVGEGPPGQPCCLFPVLAGKTQASRLAPFLPSKAIDFSFPSFVLFVASLAPHNCIISADEGACHAHQRLGLLCVRRPGPLPIQDFVAFPCADGTF